MSIIDFLRRSVSEFSESMLNSEHPLNPIPMTRHNAPTNRKSIAFRRDWCWSVGLVFFKDRAIKINGTVAEVKTLSSFAVRCCGIGKIYAVHSRPVPSEELHQVKRLRGFVLRLRRLGAHLVAAINLD